MSWPTGASPTRSTSGSTPRSGAAATGRSTAAGSGCNSSPRRRSTQVSPFCATGKHPTSRPARQPDRARDVNRARYSRDTRGAFARWRLESPEVLSQTDTVEDRLVLLPCVGSPVGRETVLVPGVRQLGQRRDRDGDPVGPAAEPSFDVLLRPEEVHRASRERDVVPPPGRGNEAMEEQPLVVGPVVSNLDHDRIAAVGTGRLDSAIGT